MPIESQTATRTLAQKAIAAGIVPNVELGRKAGLEVKRGIVVNDSMETSNPDIFAVGECVQHGGICYGLVAPLLEQGKVLAATITGNKGPTYQGTVLASKLKIMGVDVFSAGEIKDKVDGSEVVRYEDPSLGIYKKLTLKDGRLTGAILVGDTTESSRYLEMLRSGKDITPLRKQLLFLPQENSAEQAAEMPDGATVCGCINDGVPPPKKIVWLRSRKPRARLPDAGVAPSSAAACSRRRFRIIRKTPSRCSVPAFHSRRSSCARSSAASDFAPSRMFWIFMAMAWDARSASPPSAISST